jgi:hypothetical protein
MVIEGLPYLSPLLAGGTARRGERRLLSARRCISLNFKEIYHNCEYVNSSHVPLWPLYARR